MANRFVEMVLLDGEKLNEDITKLAGSRKLLAESIGMNVTTLTNAINGKPISAPYAEKIERGMFKPVGYYRKREASTEVGGGSTGNSEKILLAMGRQLHTDLQSIVSLMEDIKQQQEELLQQQKVQATLTARLLANWEGKDEKGN